MDVAVVLVDGEKGGTDLAKAGIVLKMGGQ